MIIDQLPAIVSAQDTDELAIERGTTTYKATVKQVLDELDTDATPTDDSTKPVQSGGVYDALQGKQDAISAVGILKGSGSAVSAATIGTDYTSVDDTLSSSTTKTYSIDKIKSLQPTITGVVHYDEAQTLTDVQKTQARSNIGAAKEWTLLWTNQNPNSDFAEQTVAVDVTGYERIKIDFNLNASSIDPIYYTSEVAVDFNRALFFGFWGGKYAQRPTPSGWVSSNGIKFSDAQYYNSYGGSASTANNYLVPYRIYAR